MLNILPDKKRFLHLSSKYQSIPVVATEPLGDNTPFSIYEQIGKNQPYSFLFNSGKKGPSNFRYSYIGCNPSLVFSYTKNLPPLLGKKSLALTKDPFTHLQALINKESANRYTPLPHFSGGFVGYFSYDAVRLFEKIPNTTHDDLNIPDILLMQIDELIVIDHGKNLLKIIISVKNNTRDYDKALKKIASLHRTITANHPIPQPTTFTPLSPSEPFNKDCNKSTFISMVDRAKQYIEEGDIYQANISHRLSTPYPGDPFLLYKKIQTINPSPFACFFQGPDFSIVSSSPERLVRVKGDKIDTRPIAGTRPRGKNIPEDTGLSQELLLNEKERAEHLMLVDLERNDISKVCEHNSVIVNEFMSLEKYSHVWHIVSNIEGRIKKGVPFIKVLEACFPGGTITGCPKIRCMEIIDELETTNRSYYTGSFGYIGYDGAIDLNILIRTILIKKKTAFFQVGAGIVADSDPEKEYYETIDKAKALLTALEISI